MSVISSGSSFEVERWWARLPFRHIAVPYALHLGFSALGVLDQTPMNWCFVSLKGGNSSVEAFKDEDYAAPSRSFDLSSFCPLQHYRQR